MALSRFQQAKRDVDQRTAELEPDVTAELDRAFTRVARGAATALRAAADWGLPDADEIYDAEALELAINKALARAKDELDASIRLKLGAAPPGDYDVPLVARLAAARHRQDVQRLLLDGWNEGRSVDQVADDLALVGQSSSLLVARTSLNGINNSTSLAGAVFAGVHEKQWLTAEDDRVRDTHAEIDGEAQPLSGVFTNGCRFPGDPNGPPEEVWNCRCTLIYPDAVTAGGPAMETTDTVEQVNPIALALTAAAEERATSAPSVLATWASPGLAFLNRPTGDGRALTGDISWAELPLPLMAQLDDAHGSMPTMQSRMAGGINALALEGDAFPASGVLDDTEAGREALAALETGRVGVSIDLAVEEWEMALDAEAWGWLFGLETTDEEPEPANEGPSRAKDAGLVADDAIVFAESTADEMLVITKGRIRGATIVPFAAFEQARIEITASGEQGAPEMIRYTAPVTLVVTREPAGVSTDVLAAISALEQAVELDKVPALSAAVQAGILTENEAREALGRAPLDRPAPTAEASGEMARVLDELKASAQDRDAALSTLRAAVEKIDRPAGKITFVRDDQGRVIGAERS